MNSQKPIMRSVVQCPECGFRVTEQMSLRKNPKQYQCPGCNSVTNVAEDDCCIFCVLGRTPCPPQQLKSMDD